MSNKLKNSIKSVSDYNMGGITHIWILDINDFTAYKFTNDSLSDNCMIDGVVTTTSFVELQRVDESSFTEDFTDNVYRQKLNTFVYSLEAGILENLLTATNNKYLVAFRTTHGRSFTFGSDGGATLSFNQKTGQSGELAGYNITLSKNSIYPLFEISDVENQVINFIYSPIFSGNVFCQLQNSKQTGYQIAAYAIKETIDGQKVDINGDLCSLSGKKQAIHILEGTQNPNTYQYEIEKEYTFDSTNINGNTIVQFNINQCPPQIDNSITGNKIQIVFDENENSSELNISSMHDWKLVKSTNIANCNPKEGKAGKTTITITKSGNKGIADFEFKNQITQQSIVVNIINQDNVEWVLKNGAWNNNGYWLASEQWQ